MAQTVPPSLQHVVASAEELAGPHHLGGKGLKVLEVHSWGGPCKSVLPTFKRIRMEKDNEASLAFLIVDADALAAPPPALAAAAAAAPPPPPPAKPAHARGAGAAPPAEGLQAVLEHAGRSEPLFLFYRNGQLKARIAGADLPRLAALVAEHAPANPEVDDIEDNPFHACSGGAKDPGGGKDKGKGKKGGAK
ncbi:MAG: dynein 16 kDa light chain, flagellar outer arm [Monoraphidium minutum]|nr:MAG: dynein 16 kDa light chain, flagellar outer arm [Monoraphidium minutum]